MTSEEQNSGDEQANQPEGVDAGEELLGWESWDKPPLERSRRWYIIAGMMALGLVIYAVLTVNYLFAAIVLMLGITMLVTGLKKARRVPVHITNMGVVVADELFPFKEMKDFSVVYDPPDVKNLYIDFKSTFKPILAIDLDDVNPNLVRETMLQFVPENLDREEEHMSDILRRVYKL